MRFLARIEACPVQQVRLCLAIMIRPTATTTSGGGSRTHMNLPAFNVHKLRPELIGASQGDQSCSLVQGVLPPTAAMIDPAQRARMARNREEALRRLQSRQSLAQLQHEIPESYPQHGGQPSSMPAMTNTMHAINGGPMPSVNYNDTRSMQARYNSTTSTGNLMNQIPVANQQSSGILGALPQEKHSFESGTALRRQEFDYVIVIDFEATCDKGMQSLTPQEIIEFPAVIVDCKQLTVGDCFQTYVKPVHHPILTEFCTQLTGIKQEQVDKGIPLVEALYWHDQWLESKGIKGKKFAILIWSDWDCKTMLESECKLKGLNKPQYFNRWINLKLLFQNAFNGRRCNLRKAVETSGLTWTGRAHCGLDDALNTARLALELMRRGMVLTITGTLDPQPLIAQIRRPVWPATTMQVNTAQGILNNNGSVSNNGNGTVYGDNLNQADDENSAQNLSINGGNIILRCYCGAFCNRRTVKKPGPTCGRSFLACGNWSITEGSKCDFFQWVVP